MVKEVNNGDIPDTINDTSYSTGTSSWFKGKGTLLKCLAFLLVALIVILIALFVNLVVRKDDPTCRSQECIKESAEKLRQIDTSADLCEDFYAMACGNIFKNYTTPLEFPDPEKQLEDMILEQFTENDTQPFLMQKSFYKSCMNLAALEIDRDESMLRIFDRLGYWPVLRGEYWNASDYDWIDFMVKCKNLGLEFEWFLEFDVVRDNNTQRNYLKIDIPKYLKPLNSSLSHARKELFTEIAVALNASQKLAHYETGKTINFEDELGQIAEKHRQVDDEWYRPLRKVTIREIQESWPSINWHDLIERITGIRMLEDELIVFDILDYVKDLVRALLGTPKRIQVDFMMWKILEDAWPYLSGTLRSPIQRYQLENFGIEPEPDRQKFCLEKSRKLFPLVAESVYINMHGTYPKRQQAHEMVGRIRQQLVNRINDAKWIGQEDIRKAVDKVLNAQVLIGGPNEIYDLNRFYDQIGVYGFKFTTRNVIEMINQRRVKLNQDRFNLLRTDTPRTWVDFYKDLVNVSIVSIVNNTLVIPASLLQDIYFNPELPTYLNYATLGRAIARELFKYVTKEDGYYVSWVSEGSVRNLLKCGYSGVPRYGDTVMYKERAYRKYISEFVAIDVAYEAYQEWTRNHAQEYSLPGLTYTPGQLFWIHTTKFLCGRPLSKGDKKSSTFTIIEPLMNSNNFAREFGCPEGSKMNPAKKCSVL